MVFGLQRDAQQGKDVVFSEVNLYSMALFVLFDCDPRTGYLPPSVHDAGWRDVAGRFAGNSHRARLMGGLLAACRNLATAGCGERPIANKQEVLKTHCRAVGRDYDEIKQVTCRSVLVAENEKELSRLKADPNVRSGRSSLVGTPEQVTEALLEEIDQGADRFVVSIADAPRAEGTHLFAAAVMPHLKR